MYQNIMGADHSAVLINCTLFDCAYTTITIINSRLLITLESPKVLRHVFISIIANILFYIWLIQDSQSTVSGSVMYFTALITVRTDDLQRVECVSTNAT